MAIARIDTPTKTTQANIGDAGIYTYPAGSNRMTLVIISSETQASTVTAVSENDGSASLTLLEGVFYGGEIAQAWYLLEADIPGDGISNGFTVTGASTYTVYIFTLSGVDQTPTIPETGTENAIGDISADPQTITITTTSGGYAIVVITDQTGTGGCTFSDDAVELIDDDQGGYQTFIGEALATGTSVDMTMSGADGSGSRVVWFSLDAATGTFTASAGLTTGGASFSGSASFTPPTYSGSAALTPAGSDLTASAAVTNPTYAATAAVDTGAATITASGATSEPTYTASASLTGAAATLAGSASFVAPVYTASAALDAAAAAFTASATFTSPVYTASAPLIAAAAECTATVSASGPIAQFIATADLTTAAATHVSSASVAADTFTGSLAASVGAAIAAANATFTTPVYDASCSVTVAAPTCTATDSDGNLIIFYYHYLLGA